MNNSSNKISGLVKSVGVGGGDDFYKIQSFLALIIIGYFGVKIVLSGFFNFYPDKYYYRTVDIETTDSSPDLKNTKNIALNAFMPGLWNNEITDFVVAIILTAIVYVFTQGPQRKMFERGGKVDTFLVIGYIIGLSFPIFYKTFRDKCKLTVSDSCKNHNTLIILTSVILLVFLYIVNSKYPDENKSNYFIYMIGIILIIIALYYTRKMRRTYLSVNYYKNKDQQCLGTESGYLFSDGDQFILTPAFASWILLLFFVIEPSGDMVRKVIYFIYGLLLGIFVSSMSYYGIDYFLIKVPEKKCMSLQDCVNRDMGKPPKNISVSTTGENVAVYEEEEEILSIKPKPQIINIFKVILILFIILMFGYFVMFSKKK